MHADEVPTSVALVGLLVREQFPEWAEHAVEARRLLRHRSRAVPAR